MVEGMLDLVESPSCFGEDGRITIDTSSLMGGRGPYRYIIDARQPVDVADTTFLPASETPYEIVFVDRNSCRSESMTFMIDIPDEVAISISGDTLIDIGFSGELSTSIISPSPVDTIIWTPNNEEGVLFECLTIDCGEIRIMPVSDVTFTATIFNEEGCSAIASIDVDVRRNEDIYIPNVFFAGQGPVSDDRNRLFQVFPGTAVESIDFIRVFDRWGNLVHDVTDVPLPVGNGMAQHEIEKTLLGFLSM